MVSLTNNVVSFLEIKIQASVTRQSNHNNGNRLVCMLSKVELHWLEQSWDHENWFQSKVVPASQCKFPYL